MKELEEILDLVEVLKSENKNKEIIELISDDVLEKYKDFRLYDLKSYAYSESEDYLKSNELLEKALEIEPNSYYRYELLGNNYRSLKSYDKAIESFSKFIEFNPDDPYAFARLGLSYDDIGNKEKAIEAFNRAIELDSEDPFYYNRVGLLHFEQGELKKSVKFYEKSIKFDPKYKYAYFNLGNVYSELDENEKALKAYEKSIESVEDWDENLLDFVKSKILDLQKRIKNKEYDEIKLRIDEIKKILLFDGDCLTHYTSLSVAEMLIFNNSLFRLSEGSFLNDTSEGKELFKYLDYELIEMKRNETSAELYSRKPFIGSFVSENKNDDLTLWRMYGKEKNEEAKGCALTLQLDKLKEKLDDVFVLDTKLNDKVRIEEFKFYRVAYRDVEITGDFKVPGLSSASLKKLNKRMSELLTLVNKFKENKKNDQDDKHNLNELLNEVAFLFKSNEYQYENELRLVIKGAGFDKKISNKFSPPRVFIELVSIKELISKITLGPKVDRSDEWATAFYYSQEKLELYPEIFISKLPFK